jgi:flagellar motor switch protein FliM
MSPKPLTIEAVLAASRATDGKLQALSPVFARLSDSLSDVAKALCSKPLRFSFESFETSQAKGAALIADSVLSCRIRAENWNAVLALNFDRAILFAMTEAMFGGNGEEQSYSEERPLSSIEKQLAKEMQSAVIRALRTSFQSVAETSFAILDEAATRAAPGSEKPPPSDFYVRFLAHLWGYSGEMQLGLPRAAVLMLLDKLRVPSGQAVSPRPSKWNGQIRQQISDADVSLTAVLSEIEMSLDALARLKRGQVIKLAARLGQPVHLVSDGEPIFDCGLGQSQGRYVLSIEGPRNGS